MATLLRLLTLSRTFLSGVLNNCGCTLVAVWYTARAIQQFFTPTPRQETPVAGTHLAYPEFNIACAIELIGIVRNGEIVERRAEAGKHAWTLAGAFNGILLGEWSEGDEPDAPPPIPDFFGKSASDPYGDEESCAMLSKMCASKQTGVKPDAGNKMYAGLPYFEIVRLAIWLLRVWRDSIDTPTVAD